MKKSVYISMLIMITGTLSAQQFPFMEGYNVNPFSLSPAFAGIHNNNTLFLDYRSDWSGLEGGPKTYQLSYSSRLYKKVGLGGRFIYDKTDIFKQTLLLGTYTYEINFAQKHSINFGLSGGLYKNSIDMAKYFNNPDYVNDAALISGLERSKLKFVSDISILYRTGNFESGILFSNLMFGSAKYSAVEVSYKPFNNYMIHTGYNFQVSDRWEVKPFVLWRAGKNAPGLLEVATAVTYNKKVWATAVYRSAGIWGLGAGAQLLDGVLINYSYNLSTNVAMNIFGSHQITLGFRLFKPSRSVSDVQVIQKPVEFPVAPVIPETKPAPVEVAPVVAEKAPVKETQPEVVKVPVTKSTVTEPEKLSIQRENVSKAAIQLGQIHFETNRSVITEYSMPILREFLKVLKENPDMKFEIRGHTDNVGSPESNKRLSLERAQVCVDFLISNGISPDRVKAVGYGQEQPLFPNDTPENKARNRRVEAIIIE